MASFSEFSAMFQGIRHRKSACFAALLPLFVPVSAGAQTPLTQNVVQTYADLVGLAESSPLVVFAELKKLKVMDGYHSWASMCWCELLIQIDTIQHIRLLLHWQVGTS
jgi:hypothetical protein